MVTSQLTELSRWVCHCGLCVVCHSDGGEESGSLRPQATLGAPPHPATYMHFSSSDPCLAIQESRIGMVKNILIIGGPSFVRSHAANLLQAIGEGRYVVPLSEDWPPDT